MKNLLNYQSSEYDCGPVSIINGIRYLFEREEIYPEMIKFIMLYCMDTYNETGELCKQGTSSSAITFMADWLNHFGETRKFPIKCEVISGEAVTLTPGSQITEALRQGGAVVLRLYLEVPHYVLLTEINDENVLMFDPFYEEEDDPELDEEYFEEGISFINNSPKKANRAVSLSRINGTGKNYYEMGKLSERKALIMFNTSL
ncbi:MAG: peptidase C39 [Suilimivivens sp.]